MVTTKLNTLARWRKLTNMVCFEVYSKYHTTKYRSTLCSKTTFFVVFTKLVSFLLPLILAYNSKGFWIKRDIFYEQPDIKYRYEYIFIANTDDLSSPILCSNVVEFDKRIINHNTKKCSAIKVREIDHNLDKKYDELLFSLQVSDLDNLRIQSVILILPLDYKIHTTCPIHMQTTAVIQHSYSNSGVRMNFIGDISLVQNHPISCYSQKTFKEYNKSLIEDNFEMWNFMEKNCRRNVSTKIDNFHITWIPGSLKTFDVNIHLKYPEQAIIYKPNFWQVIKYAWIQYLAIFVAIRWIIHKIENYVFTNKLIRFYVDDTKKKMC